MQETRTCIGNCVVSSMVIMQTIIKSVHVSGYISISCVSSISVTNKVWIHAQVILLKLDG